MGWGDREIPMGHLGNSDYCQGQPKETEDEAKGAGDNEGKTDIMSQERARKSRGGKYV